MEIAKFLSEFAAQFPESLPPSLQILRKAFEQQLERGLAEAIKKLDLVSRKEFDIQTNVLALMRERLTQLERRVLQLEETRLP